MSIQIPRSIDAVQETYCRFQVHNNVTPELFAYKVIERIEITSNGIVIDFTNGYVENEDLEKLSFF